MNTKKVGAKPKKKTQRKKPARGSTPMPQSYYDFKNGKIKNKELDA